MRSILRLCLPLTILLVAVAVPAQTAGNALTTKEVVFGNFKPYVHPDKSFSIDLPENWSIDNSSTATEGIVKVTDPSTNAALVIHVWKQAGELKGGSTEFLKAFLKRTAATLPKYTEGEPKVQKDGSVGIYFKYEQTTSAGVFNMWGDSFIQRDGELVGMLFFIIPKEQYDLKTKSAYRLINSFKLDPNGTN